MITTSGASRFAAEVALAGRLLLASVTHADSDGDVARTVLAEATPASTMPDHRKEPVVRDHRSQVMTSNTSPVGAAAVFTTLV